MVRKFQGKVEAACELDVARDQRWRDRRAKTRVREIIEFSQIWRIGSRAAQKGGRRGFRQVDETDRQLERVWLAGSGADRDITQAKVKSEVEVVAARQDGVQRPRKIAVGTR